jgi:DNA repair exonuclease SbcCD nuclease subunit
MKRAIVFSDLHAHDYKQFNASGSRLQNCVDVIEYVFDLAAKNDIKIIIFPGDLFDQFGTMYTRVMNEVIGTFKILFKTYPDIKFYAITGNHDQGEKSHFGASCESSLTTLDRLFDHFILIDNQVVDIGGAFLVGIPFYSTPEDFKEALQYFDGKLSPFDHNYLLMHQTIWPDNPVVPQDVDPEDELFQNYSLVFNGHIHAFGEYGKNIVNVGSPLHRDLGDLGIAKYIVIVDLEQAVYDIKDITARYPQYRRLKVGEVVPEEWERDYIVREQEQLETTSEKSFSEIKFSSSLKPQDLIRNYVREVSGDDAVYAVGMSLLNPIQQEEGILLTGRKIFISWAKIEGFRNILQFEFNYDNPGLNIIKGMNGVGKSTIFEALVWGLYGETMKKTKQEKILTWPEVRGDKWLGTRVSIHFNVNDMDYQVIRHIGYEGLTLSRKGADTLILIEGGVHVTTYKSKPELQEYITSILGMSCEVFINSIIFGQRMQRLVQLENNDKRGLFEELFSGMDFVSEMKENCVREIKEREDKLKDLTMEFDQLNVVINSLDTIITTKEKVLADFNAKNVIDTSAYNIQKVNLENKIQHDQQLLDCLVVASSPTQEEINVLMQEYMTQKNLSDAADAKELEIINKNNNLIQIVSHNRSLLSQYEKAAGNVETNYQEAVKKHTVFVATAQTKLDKVIESKKNALENISNVCAACGQALPDNDVYRQHVVEEWDEKIADAAVQLDDANNMAPVKGAVTHTQEDIDKANTNITEAIKKQKLLSEELAALPSKNELLILTNEKFNAWDNAQKLVTAYEKVKEEMTKFKDSILQDKASLKMVEQSLTEIANRIPPDVDTTSDKENLNVHIEERDLLDQQILVLPGELEPYHWWNKTGLAANGLSAFMFKAMLSRLNSFTEEYGKRLGVSVRMSIDLSKASKPFTTTCSIGNSVNKDYEELSGGQKQRIDIVLMWAMHELVTSVNFVNVLVLDEAVENLDAGGEEAVMELVRFKAEKGYSIYMITHKSGGDYLNAKIWNAELIDDQFTLS